MAENINCPGIQPQGHPQMGAPNTYGLCDENNSPKVPDIQNYGGGFNKKFATNNTSNFNPSGSQNNIQGQVNPNITRGISSPSPAQFATAPTNIGTLGGSDGGRSKKESLFGFSPVIPNTPLTNNQKNATQSSNPQKPGPINPLNVSSSPKMPTDGPLKSPSKPTSNNPTNLGFMDMAINPFEGNTNTNIQNFYAEETAKKTFSEIQQKEADALALQDGKMAAKDVVEPKIRAWAYTKMNPQQMNNIRFLLSTLHEITWINSKWEPIIMSELMTDAQVKKGIRKWQLKLHPDKHTDVTDPETLYLIDRINDIMNESKKNYEMESKKK